MPKHHEKKKKKKHHPRETIDLDQLRQLAKAHRHKCDKKKPSESSSSGDHNNTKAIRVPQSKSEYDQEQSVVRKVVDPETGRTR
ncbi:hypothetical protein NQZ79_g5271 [Umbelopsis isabellina]|nr:hypothetical protein NQZ79_g5271 [Umbelopsis isabellina]